MRSRTKILQHDEKTNRLHPFSLFIVILALLLAASITLSSQTYVSDVGDAVVTTRTTDSSLTQIYTGHFGWTINLPAEDIAKFNRIGSKVNEAGMSEVVNFMLRGNRGGVTMRYYTERRMLPAGYKLLDSTIHYYEADSTGKNGHIYRRTYVMSEQAVEIELMLTETGEADLGAVVRAIFDSFMPPADAGFELEKWRYGRNAADYEAGDYPRGGGPDR